MSSFDTHEVLNQPPAYTGKNLFEADPILRAGLRHVLDGKAEAGLAAHGAFWGSEDAQDLAAAANRHAPILHTHDAQGRRADAVEFHPAYHALMTASIEAGLHASVWDEAKAEHGRRHALRAARVYMTAQTECGHLCPMTMTHAAPAALAAAPALLSEWLPRIRSRVYDPRLRPAAQKSGVTFGMGMTEKQGGSDVRTNRTQAQPDGGSCRLVGHKWFLSAPMSDAFLVTAQAPGGLSCFLVPRVLPDGAMNALRFQRLKDKLGNRSNASSEVEFAGTTGFLVGEEGRGIPTILGMVQLTRLDCALASAGIMRAAVAEAVHHARHRAAFGRVLIEQPLMRRVLADLALDAAAAAALALRLASAFDRHASEADEAAYARLVTPAAKYWICKTAPALTYEAMECLGGNGYVETGRLARLYREAPVNAIWEGSGNVIALDVLRAVERDSRALHGVADRIGEVLGAATADAIRGAAEAARADPAEARRLAETLALTAAAAALTEIGAGTVADAFAETRLSGGPGATYGALASRFDAGEIVRAVCPG